MEPYAISEAARRLTMALLMLTHIQIAAFIIGALVIGVTSEFLSLVLPRFREPLLKLAHGISFVAVLVYSSGAVLAIVFVWVIAQLWPPFWLAVMRINFWPMVLEAITFALTIAFLFPYYYTWQALSRFRGVHLSLGLAAWAAVHIQQAMIDVMAGYMLTPAPAGQVLRVFLNPTVLPLDVHRTLGNVSFAGFVIAAYAGIRALRARKSPDAAKRSYYEWLGGLGLTIGIFLLVLQPAVGLFYLEEIRWHSPGAFNTMMRGRLSSFFLLQATALAALFFLSVLYMARQARGLAHPGARWLKRLTLINLLGCLLLVQPYVIGPSQYTLWVRWVNPIGAMQPWKYIALAVITLSAAAALLIFLGHGLRSMRRAREGEIQPGAQRALIALGLLASGMMLLMGYIRESGRLPYLVFEKQRIDNPMLLPTYREPPPGSSEGQGEPR
jgi:cytochrome d ubiquinol oxidase subunit I